MRSRRLPMSLAAYHGMEWEPGWKYEYWDGCAHISPQEVGMDCTLPVEARCCPPDAQPIAPAVAADAGILVQAFLDAFADGVEYCDWPADRIEQDARRCIDGFFAGRRGAPLPASRVAWDRTGADAVPVGACMVTALGPSSARIDLLFVVPERQRRGLATAMAGAALGALRAAGFRTLDSRYLLGNRASRAWHRRFGFTDRPDWLAARHLLAHARHALERQGALAPDPAATARLAAKVARWEAQVEALDPVRGSDSRRQG